MNIIKKRDDYNTGHNCTWCPGCGNFGLWYMLKQALLELNLQSHQVVIVYDIGCNGNGANFTKTYAFHGLHGRSIPAAQGVQMVNSGVKVIVMSGDGGGLGLGVGHFIHACRRNADITYILHDNQVYGLTTGQTSPRTDKGMKTKTSPSGSYEEPVNPISLALSSKASFVARSFSGNPHHLKDTLKTAIQHKGFAFVDVLQPCITFNKVNTYAWYNERSYILQDDAQYSTDSLEKAYSKAFEWEEKIPLGIFFSEERQTLLEAIGVEPDILNKNPQRDITSALEDFHI